MKNCYVYWIRHKNHTNSFTQGYIGISTNPQKRWIAHFKYNGNVHLTRAIEKYGKNNLIKEILLVAKKSYCLSVEALLRPDTNIGWNIAKGGGNPPITSPRGPDYISPLKGVSRPTPWLIGSKPWNTGLKGYWSEEQKQKFIERVSKPHTKDHIEK